jgi:hypothetical protein
MKRSDFFGRIDRTKVQLKNWVIKVFSVNIYGRQPMIKGGDQFESSILEAQGHSATACKKIDSSN